MSVDFFRLKPLAIFARRGQPAVSGMGRGGLQETVRALLAKAARITRDHGLLRKRYPRIAQALRPLKDAVAAELPPQTRCARRRSSPRRAYGVTADAWRKRTERLKEKCAKLEASLDSMQRARGVDGRISEEWITRIICASPHTSARALVESLTAALAVDRGVISRWSISKIKAAWVEMYTEMVGAATGRRHQPRAANQPRAAWRP